MRRLENNDFTICDYTDRSGEAELDFILAGTFVESLQRLPARDQKDVKVSVMDLQLNPAQPSLSLHRVDKSKDPNFWSARVNLDIRLILHKTAQSLMVAYVDHHDAAYGWAIRRKIEKHPKTSVMQIVQIPERVAEIQPEIAHLVGRKAKWKPALNANVRPFCSINNDALLSIGVPKEWIEPIRNVDEDEFLEIAHLLPPESADALLEYASGKNELSLMLNVSDLNEKIDRNLFGTRAIDDPKFSQYVREVLGSRFAEEQLDGTASFFRALANETIDGYADRASNDTAQRSKGWFSLRIPTGFDLTDSKRQFLRVMSSDDLAYALEAQWQPWSPNLERAINSRG